MTRDATIETKGARVLVIIPAFNEARAIGRVIRDIPAGQIEEIIVVNNASTDETEDHAQAAGATVLREDRKGYGWACLRESNMPAVDSRTSSYFSMETTATTPGKCRACWRRSYAARPTS